jgi:Spore wall protein
MKLLATFGFFKMSYALLAFHSKNKRFAVQVLIPPTYEQIYNQTHTALGADLRLIAAATASAFNNSTMAKHNGYTVAFDLSTPLEHPIIAKISSPTICEGAITNITSMLNDINNMDNDNHYIAMLPCPPIGFAEVFNSVGIDIPIIESRINAECSRRLAVFLESTFSHLLASFGNALLKIIDAPISDYSSLTENNTGDDGVKQSMNLNDSTVYSILHSQCFLNA